LTLGAEPSSIVKNYPSDNRELVAYFERQEVERKIASPKKKEEPVKI
jgi:hypothetical protein